MKKFALFFWAIILLAIACNKTDPADQFSNSLKLGTGLSATNSFVLTGEGTVFQSGILIYFRLESKDDMAGSAVRINVNPVGSATTETHDFPSLQSYGHIYLSSFLVQSPGDYIATGILADGDKTIASINFTVQ
ncbi:MAG: hypothetical protein IPP15_06155 [Saprospiraceae bacterium]|uniref:DUF4625 domain-containing protein n=1 Tax=Candidatus Opimibacter skivensis TaxID=2982028 RepID=A0A9D7XM95_9BACT|nr:hypothetical protein [Candidatus Opimibacter skivensis]